MNETTKLAVAQLTRAAAITIELTNPDGPVTITWPESPLSVSSHHFPDVAATLTRMFANASIQLGRMNAGRRQP